MNCPCIYYVNSSETQIANGLTIPFVHFIYIYFYIYFFTFYIHVHISDEYSEGLGLIWILEFLFFFILVY